MKKLIVMAVAILITAFITAFASGTPGLVPKKEITYEISFRKIVVLDDIDLQLKESNNKIIEVTGNDADIKNVDWKIKGGVLYLKSRKGSLKDKIKVKVNVDQLKEIHIKGQSKVSSEGPLLSPGLYVYMEDDCYVSIKNTGQIYVVKGTDMVLEVERMVGDVKVGR